MVEIDGMKMVQSRAILCYIAGKYNLYGKDLKERAWYSSSAYCPYLYSSSIFSVYEKNIAVKCLCVKLHIIYWCFVPSDPRTA